MIDQITPEEAVLSELPSFVDLENLDARGDANFWRVDESYDHEADLLRGEFLIAWRIPGGSWQRPSHRFGT